MKSLKNPFNLYDFFGYLFPGITFCFLFLLCGHCQKSILQILKSTTDLGFSLNITSAVFLLLFLGYILGHIISALSSYFWERLIVECIFKFPSKNMFFTKSEEKMWFCSKYRRGYSSDFQEKFKILFEETFHIDFNNPSDIFWLTFEYVAHNCPVAFSRASNFLNLYGFSRNLSMSFFLGGIFMVIPSFYMKHDISNSRLLWLCITMFASLLLFNNYMKLLKRCNDEIFRAFYAHFKQKQQETSSQQKNTIIT